MTTIRALCLSLVLVLSLCGCKKEEQYPPAQYAPYGTAPTDSHVSYPPTPGAATTAPAPSTPPASMAPALGFPCAADTDVQCPFARCIENRCGGCADASYCKPGSACAATPFGMACVQTSSSNVPTAPPIATSPPPTGDAFAQARAVCLSKTNEYRARVGASPVQRRTDQETCADGEAASDASTGRAHGAFGKCGEQAQNECPGWPGPADSTIGRCLQTMFDEGPGEGAAHGHYNNMVSSKYSGVACGFHQKADGSLWIIQNFYP